MAALVLSSTLVLWRLRGHAWPFAAALLAWAVFALADTAITSLAILQFRDLNAKAEGLLPRGTRQENLYEVIYALLRPHNLTALPLAFILAGTVGVALLLDWRARRSQRQPFETKVAPLSRLAHVAMGLAAAAAVAAFALGSLEPKRPTENERVWLDLDDRIRRRGALPFDAERIVEHEPTRMARACIDLADQLLGERLSHFRPTATEVGTIDRGALSKSCIDAAVEGSDGFDEDGRLGFADTACQQEYEVELRRRVSEETLARFRERVCRPWQASLSARRYPASPTPL